MRGAGPIAVLKLLERREMYGYEISEALSQRTDGVLEMGQSTLYPLLYNLEAKGLVASRWDESAARGRKYYALTASGKRRLADDTRQWQAAVDAMRALGVVAPSRSVASVVLAILGCGAPAVLGGARLS